MERKTTILVVDDEPALVEVLEAYLRDEGFIVLQAADGQHRPPRPLLSFGLGNQFPDNMGIGFEIARHHRRDVDDACTAR